MLDLKLPNRAHHLCAPRAVICRADAPCRGPWLQMPGGTRPDFAERPRNRRVPRRACESRTAGGKMAACVRYLTSTSVDRGLVPIRSTHGRLSRQRQATDKSQHDVANAPFGWIISRARFASFWEGFEVMWLTGGSKHSPPQLGWTQTWYTRINVNRQHIYGYSKSHSLQIRSPAVRHAPTKSPATRPQQGAQTHAAVVDKRLLPLPALSSPPSPVAPDAARTFCPVGYRML